MLITTGRWLAALFLVSMLAACGGGPPVIKEAQMADRGAVASLAKKHVAEDRNLRPKALRVALIGVNGHRSASDEKSGSRWDPSGVSRMVADIQNKTSQATDVARSIPCAALDATFDSLLPALEFAGMKAVPVSELLSTPAYSSLAENIGGSVFCVATKARASAINLGMNAVLARVLGQQDRMETLNRTLARLIDEAGLDGVLITVVSAHDMWAGESTLALLAKKPDGSVEAVWQGTLKAKQLKFEPVVADERSDADRVQNIARVYHHAFTLLAAKLAQDATR